MRYLLLLLLTGCLEPDPLAVQAPKSPVTWIGATDCRRVQIEGVDCVICRGRNEPAVSGNWKCEQGGKWK